MGGTCSNDKKIVTRTIVLTEPVVKSDAVTSISVPKQTAQGSIISNKNVPLFIKKVQTWAWENSVHHHTKAYTLPKSGTLVVRRGQPFKMTLTFNRAYNSLTDELKFFFETGDNPLPGNDTMVCMSSYTSQGSSGWKSDFLPVVGTKSRDGIEANLWIFTPPDCIVSDWKFSLQSMFRTELDMATVTYEHPDRIYILFNPWCKDDAVYFPAEPLLEEYIMNPSGIMFQGCHKRMTVKPWVFGQFDSGILEACIYIIKRGFNFRCSQAMGNPVIVSRNISSIVNAEDGNGVLKGLWSTNDFEGGRSPTAWSGSVAILKQYIANAIDNKGGTPEPVKYGQCFVYAGVVTTICRAIGIPCRCVTNYNSGRNIDGSLSVDLYYTLNEEGSIEEVIETNDDLVWNFHVWNDVWMKRLDLPEPLNESDWQALDATPQISSSNGLHSCGPAPLRAIKDGLVDMKYDVGFLFAEINADVVYWLKIETGDWTVFQVEESRVGRSINTKTPNGRPANLTFKLNVTEMNRIRQIVTSDYKYKKGTKIEQEIVNRSFRKERPMHRHRAKDVVFKLEEKEFEYIGTDFYVKANVTNTSDEARTINVVLLFETVHYNGRRHAVVTKKTFEKQLEPGQSELLQLGVYEEEYVGKLTEHTCVRQYGLLRVTETAQIEAWVDDFLLQKPHVEIKYSQPVYKDQNCELNLFFKNPLHRSLHKCAVSVEGAGLESMLYVRNIEKVPAECEWTGVVNVLPVRSRVIELSVTFHCAEMFDLVGSTVIKVEKAPEEDYGAGTVAESVGRI